MSIKSFSKLSLVAIVAGIALSGMASSASAQMGRFVPMCSGPMGPGPCDAIENWMAQQGVAFDADRMLPRDGQIVMQIGQSCRGEPRCMAVAWASVEVERCRTGVGTPGGCFGPNGEIMRFVNRFLPQHLQPNVIIGNIHKDLTEGPGDNNDVTGKNGWLRKRLGI